MEVTGGWLDPGRTASRAKFSLVLPQELEGVGIAEGTLLPPRQDWGGKNPERVWSSQRGQGRQSAKERGCVHL